MPKVGLVLSGGGAKGLVHVGVLQWLHEEGLEPSVIAGCSSGAIAGVLYAAGLKPKEIRDVFLDEELFTTKNFTFRKPGIFDTSKLEKMFRKYLEKKTFSNLDIPVKVVATDMQKGRSRVFSEGDVVLPVLASMAYPMVFSPVEIEGTTYLDGGIMDHFPLDVIREDCTHTLGVYLSPVKNASAKELKSIRTIAERTFRLSRHAASLPKLDRCDVLINPEKLEEYNTFNASNKRLKELFQLGYDSADKQGKDIRKLWE
jgi:NTE family protein